MGMLIKDPSLCGGDWWGGRCSDTGHGVSTLVKKKRSEVRKCEKLTDGASHAPPPPVTETQHSQILLPNDCSPSPAPSWLQGGTTKVKQSSVTAWGKPQKRAGRKGDLSWDTAAPNMKFDSSQMLPRESYRRPFTELRLELQTSGLYITEPEKNSEQRCQHFCKLLQKLGLRIC